MVRLFRLLGCAAVLLLVTGAATCGHAKQSQFEYVWKDYQTWSATVADWATAIDAAVRELEYTLYDPAVPPDTLHNHPPKHPSSRHCPPGGGGGTPPPPDPGCLGCPGPE